MQAELSKYGRAVASTSSSAGFTLIETIVAALIGVTLVLSVGLLSGRVTRQGVNADSNAAAMSIAELQIEKLKALPNPTTNTALNANSYGPTDVRADGTTGTGATYRINYTIVDNTPAAKMKKITVTVRRVSDSNLGATLVTYYAVY